jgi:hypothetical protein
MFHPDRKAARLDTLILGGCVNQKCFGDDFLRVLFHFISAPDARPIVGLSYADGGIDMTVIYLIYLVSVCLFVYLSIYLSVYLSIYLSVYLSV